jgi:hypothetical protein
LERSVDGKDHSQGVDARRVELLPDVLARFVARWGWVFELLDKVSHERTVDNLEVTELTRSLH